MGQEWVATVGASEREISVTVVSRSGHRMVLSIDGKDVEVDARHVRGSTWSVLVGDRAHVVDLAGARPSEAVGYGGSAEVAVKLEDARRKRLAEAVGQGQERSGEVIRAPIAGRVVQVLATVGASVEAGASVVVLEAMKMENELKTTRVGLVEAVHVFAGESVEAGALLVTLGAQSKS